ncbi:MAG: hypothetical protein M3P27_10510 [Acidobacteriota bacterium]|nr:hypothetical protein [Acidobacteriota bacterium]
MYIESARSKQNRRVRRSAKLLEFARSENGRRVVPHLVLEPAPPEEAGWVGKYLELADHALNNHDLADPAERSGVKSGVKPGVTSGTPDSSGTVRRRA